MKTVEIIGYKRANLGKSFAKQLRAEGNVPCVLYGGDEQISFYAPMYLFRELVYTKEAHFVNLNIEGHEVRAIMQDIQFHPVNDYIMHVDFLQLFEGKYVKMNIPVVLEGQSPAVASGGTLILKRRHLQIKALPKNMPEQIHVNISELNFHSSIKVQDLEVKDYEVLDTPRASIAVVEVPRALRGKSKEELAAAGEEEEEA